MTQQDVLDAVVRAVTKYTTTHREEHIATLSTLFSLAYQLAPGNGYLMGMMAITGSGFLGYHGLSLLVLRELDGELAHWIELTWRLAEPADLSGELDQ